jgi:predicted restriction endonuclease
MNPLDRVRLQKAAADCGFEMTATERDDGLELKSAHFPEVVHVRTFEDASFELRTPNALLLDDANEIGSARVQGYGALYAALRAAAARARTMPNRVADAFRMEVADLPRSTEAERLVVQRVGQTLFRAALLDYWQGRCCVTGLDVSELLRASHIKPWARCESDDERLDVFNGLLLSPNMDALFDSGLMTIGDDGSVVISTLIGASAIATLVTQPIGRVKGLRPQHFEYLRFHRAFVWRT